MNLLVTNDRRALAAVRFRDQATGSFVSAGLVVQGGEGRWVQNRSGVWVLTRAPGLEHHRFEFDAPPDSPPERSVSVSAVVVDARGRYLPRTFTLGVPRIPGDSGDDLFDAVVVDLPPSPALPLRPAWACARVTVRTEPTPTWPQGMPIEGALVRLYRRDHGEVCRGLTDHHGEALVISTGLPLFAAGESAVFDARVHHSARAVVDLSAYDMETGRRAAPADPDALWAARASLPDRSRGFDLSPGEMVSRDIEIPLS
ncbi:MAG: hypothetical protein H6740_07475 [Alphaproteobacteria bacterium]|nr:hypothetical protein [Alphaproteobacteria bacterium]